MKNELTQRKGYWTLRGSHRGEKFEVSFGRNQKVGKSRSIRFLATLESSGLQAAREELRGKPIIKAGSDVTFPEMEILYGDYCRQSAKPPRPNTVETYLGRLRVLMERSGAATVRGIDKGKLFSAWFDGRAITPAGKRTFASAIRNARSVFSRDALDYYKSRKVELQNPFSGLKLVAPKAATYQPIASTLRERILIESQRELAPHDAMIVWLALCAGLRKSEITAALPSWLSRHDGAGSIHVAETPFGFVPKSGESGSVPIPLEVWDTLQALRGESDSAFLVPSLSTKTDSGRLNERVRVVNAWLQQKGMTNRKPLHSLRKEFGTRIASTQGIPAAAAALRNTLEVCMATYVGKSRVEAVDMRAAAVDPFQAVADSLGMSVEELRAMAK